MKMFAISCVMLAVLATAFGDPIVFPEGEAGYDAADAGWSVLLDADNPYGDGSGEIETIAECRMRYGTVCGESVDCKDPSRMQIDVSENFLVRYPNASMEVISQCITLQEDATDPTRGFYCVNSDQVAPPEGCNTGLCEANGLNKAGGLCNRCPDVNIRYYCGEASTTQCRTATERKVRILASILNKLKKK